MNEDRDGRELAFADALGALEAIVSRLESGELSLEEALQAFEDGIGLVRLLDRRLNEAERRIEILTRTEEGTLRLQVAKEEPQ
jgi:exodeoxyribonuclease VII small subunit